MTITEILQMITLRGLNPHKILFNQLTADLNLCNKNIKTEI